MYKWMLAVTMTQLVRAGTHHSGQSSSRMKQPDTVVAALVHTECLAQHSSDLNHHQMTAELEQCYKPKTSSL